MHILGTDPGSKNLGWSIIDSENESLIAFGMGKEIESELYALVLHPQSPDPEKNPFLIVGLVVCENYRPQNFRGGADQRTGDVVEKLSQMAAQSNLPFILQDPTKVKMQIPDLDVALWLSAHGYPQLNKHIRDSIKHILYYLGQKRIRDAVERSEG